MINNRLSSLFVIFFSIFFSFATVNTHAADRANDLLRDIDKIMYATSYESYFQIINQNPSGIEQVITAYSAKQSDGKAVVLIIAPKQLQGRAVLRVGDDVWTHIPGELNLRKSTLRHSFVGGVFNNADYLATSFTTDHRAEIISENKDRYIINLTPKTDTIPYKNAELYVNKRNLRPTKLVQFAGTNVIIKTIKYDHSKKSLDGKSIQVQMSTEAEENRKYRSTIKAGDTRKRTFPEMTFTKEILPKVGSILK
ncbi:MAG: outer membrane lipoprotein-sorting protein [Magnetococcales bacterium]|nr:outer membrane lipoprotein-sorting protein [Magnetococcales bacterium]